MELLRLLCTEASPSGRYETLLYAYRPTWLHLPIICISCNSLGLIWGSLSRLHFGSCVLSAPFVTVPWHTWRLQNWNDRTHSTTSSSDLGCYL